MDRFDIFVLPFTAGLVFIVSYFTLQVVRWIRLIPKQERTKLNSIFKSPKRLFRYLVEVVKESLLHINLFRTNPLLGFMHMSLAFGWFMLIICGNLESKFYTNSHINPPYFPIFLKYFLPDMERYPLHGLFAFVMDFFLLLVLTGVFLAVVKRFIPKRYGVAKKPALSTIDRVGLAALWAIFPLRFLAESTYAGYHHSGGFLTQTVGRYFNSVGISLGEGYLFWWAYSIALGTFFFTVPFTRYMHILTEPFYLFIRYAKVDIQKIEDTFNDLQSKSCSKCGVCLNACPLATQNIDSTTQPIYLLDALRKGTLTPQMAKSCLNCRRCEEACPVGITIEPLRLRLKQEVVVASSTDHFTLVDYPKAKIGYYAGCMGKLTPKTTQSIKKIAEAAGDSLTHIDSEASICCGRPQLLAGQTALANDLMAKNRELIEKSGIEMLVTSCPICLKTFSNNYQLTIPVLHHTQYIKSLLDHRKIDLKRVDTVTAYHDPCELSRGLKITKEPRSILKAQSTLVEFAPRAKAQCCGNSLTHSTLSLSDRRAIATITLDGIPARASVLITSCPACSKAFKGASSVEVMDIAAFTASNLTPVRQVHEPRVAATTADAKTR